MESLSNSDLKILFLGSFNESEVLSGPEKYAKRLFQSLEKKHPITYVAYFESGEYSLWKKLFGFELIAGKANTIRMGLLRLIIYLLSNQFDIIHIVTFSRFALPAYLFQSGKRRVYTAHGIIKKEDAAKPEAPYFYKLKNRIAEKVFLNKSDLVITLSPYLKKELQAYYHEGILSHQLIYPGIDEAFFSAQSETRKESPIHIMFLGGFAEREKAAFPLIEEIHLKLPQVKITCVAFSSNNQDYPAIHYINKTEAHEWARLLTTCDVFISPYKGETFSIASLEAMALGKVVIVDKHAGVAGLIENKVNGFVVDTGMPTQITEILENLNSNQSIAAGIAQKAKSAVKDLTWDNAASKHFEIYSAKCGYVEEGAA
jgi:glycosyltransferase involved in cell wall biosynthesis